MPPTLNFMRWYRLSVPTLGAQLKTHSPVVLSFSLNTDRRSRKGIATVDTIRMKLMFYSYSAYDMVCGIHTYSLARGKLSVGRVANKYLTEPPGLLRTATQHVRALPFC